jgi:hypothetical protein
VEQPEGEKGFGSEKSAGKPDLRLPGRRRTFKQQRKGRDAFLPGDGNERGRI